MFVKGMKQETMILDHTPLVQISSGREILMIYTTIQDHGHLKNSVYIALGRLQRMVLETSMKHSDLQIIRHIIGTILFLMKVVMVIVSTSLRVITTTIRPIMVPIELYGLVLVEQVLIQWAMGLNNFILNLVVGLFQTKCHHR